MASGSGGAVGRVSALVEKIEAEAYARGRADARTEILALLGAAGTSARKPHHGKPEAARPARKPRAGGGEGGAGRERNPWRGGVGGNGGRESHTMESLKRRDRRASRVRAGASGRRRARCAPWSNGCCATVPG